MSTLTLAGITCIIIIVVMLIYYSAYDPARYSNHPHAHYYPYAPEPRRLHAHHDEQQPAAPAEKEDCCDGDNDAMMMMMIMAMMRKNYNNNPKIADANCVQRVLAATIPMLMARLKANGIDMNDVNYNDDNTVMSLNNIISEVMDGVMSDPNVCVSPLTQAPAKCGPTTIDVDVDGTQPSPPGGDTTRPPGGTTKPPGGTTKPPGGSTTKPPGGTTKAPVVYSERDTCAASTYAYLEMNPDVATKYLGKLFMVEQNNGFLLFADNLVAPQWKVMPASGIKTVAFDKNYVVVTNAKGVTFYATGDIHNALAFQALPDKLTQVSVKDRSLLGVTTSGQLIYYRKLTPQVTNLGKPEIANIQKIVHASLDIATVKLNASDYFVLATNSDGIVQYAQVTAKDSADKWKWTKVPGTGERDLIVAQAHLCNNRIVCLTRQGTVRVAVLNAVEGKVSAWSTLPGTLKRISVQTNAIVGIETTGRAVYATGKVLSTLVWQPLRVNSLIAADIAVSPTAFEHFKTYGEKEKRKWQLPCDLPPPAPRTRDTMVSGDCLYPGESFVSQPAQAFKLTLEATGDLVMRDTRKNTVVWNLYKADTSISKGAGPFKLCLANNGNLVLHSGKDGWLWQSDTAEKGVGPFLVGIDDLGRLVVADSRKTMLWSTSFLRTCEAAKVDYKKRYPKIGNTDPWVHYTTNVINKKGAEKQPLLWLGPKCRSCDQAAKWYSTFYPPVKEKAAAQDFLTKGKAAGRVWTAPGADNRCINTMNEGCLAQGQSLISSNGNWMMLMQNDGNLVIMDLKTNKPKWSIYGNKFTTRPKGTAPFQLCLDKDGVLMITNKEKQLLWKSDTTGKGVGPFQLTMRDDGYIELRDSRGVPTWANTYFKTCEQARNHYANEYAKYFKTKVDPWAHYNAAVLAKQGAAKEKWIWRGPLCRTCDSAAQTYNTMYPRPATASAANRDAAVHYRDVGKKEGYFWWAAGNESVCIDTLYQPGCMTEKTPFLTSRNGKVVFGVWGDGGIGVASSDKSKLYWTNNADSTRPKGKAPYTLCMQNDGNLVATNAAKQVYWSTETGGRGLAPYRLQVVDTLEAVIYDSRNVPIWSSKGKRTCEEARAQYMAEYKAVKEDPWEHFKKTRTSPTLRYAWRGPDCMDCLKAEEAYKKRYPTVTEDAVTHYVSKGKALGYLWNANNTKSCMDNIVSPSGCLLEGERLLSQNGKFTLTMQKDGNLVVTELATKAVVWAIYPADAAVAAKASPAGAAPGTCTVPANAPAVAKKSNPAPGAATTKAPVNQGKDTTVSRGKGPFKLCIDAKGVAKVTNGASTTLWFTDTENKGVGPFTLRMQDDGGVSIKDGRGVVIWGTWWFHTCNEARAQYLKDYPKVKEAGLDAWTHFTNYVLSKPCSDKEMRVWKGPLCRGCGNARTHYIQRYPDVARAKQDPVFHYTVSGVKEKRIWSGLGDPEYCKHVLKSPGCIGEGARITSPNGQFHATLQKDGNFVVYKQGQKAAMWASSPNDTTRPKGKNPLKLCMQDDGNLVIYNSTPAPNNWIWQTDTTDKGKGPFSLSINDKGTLTVTDSKGVRIWTNGSDWMRTCTEARAKYLADHVDVKRAGEDPWSHYVRMILKNAPGKEKETREWPGPKCRECDKAKDYYIMFYPEVKKADAAKHYLKNTNRIWTSTSPAAECALEDTLKSPKCLNGGQSLMSSDNNTTFEVGTDGILRVKHKGAEVWKHTTYTTRVPGKGPYKVCMKSDGNLEATNGEGKVYFDTYTGGGMGNGPNFALKIQNDKNLVIYDNFGRAIWGSQDTARTCKAASDTFAAEYMSAAQKNKKTVPWDLYKAILKNTPKDINPKWRGPRCDNCPEAIKRYNENYPDGKNGGAAHYVKAAPGRIWSGNTADNCIPATPKPPTKAPAPAQPTPKAAVKLCNRTAYAIRELPSVGGKRAFAGKLPGDVTCVFPRDGTYVPKEGTFYEYEAGDDYAKYNKGGAAAGGNVIEKWAQCGGKGGNCKDGTDKPCVDTTWPGKSCSDGFTCRRKDEWWHQCRDNDNWNQ
jgi:hypothetical protein